MTSALTPAFSQEAESWQSARDDRGLVSLDGGEQQGRLDTVAEKAVVATRVPPASAGMVAVNVADVGEESDSDSTPRTPWEGFKAW